MNFFGVLRIKYLFVFSRLILLYKIRGLDHILSRLEKQKVAQQSKPRLPINRIESFARTILKFLLRSNSCMQESIAFYKILTDFNHPITFNIGVAKHPFAAHAWIEHNGQVICANTTEHFRFYRIKVITNQ